MTRVVQYSRPEHVFLTSLSVAEGTLSLYPHATSKSAMILYARPRHLVSPETLMNQEYERNDHVIYKMYPNTHLPVHDQSSAILPT